MASRPVSLLLVASALFTAVPAAAQETPPTAPPAEDTAVPSETQPEPASPPTSPAPAPTPGKEPAPGAPTDPSTNEADKRIGVGIDAVFGLPVGDFATSTGPMAGPVLRFGYRVIPRLEIALRAGYLFGTKKTLDGVLQRVDILPLWLGARVFMWKPFVGPYLAVEGGMNSLLPSHDNPVPGEERLTELRRRFGGNLGAGYLLSPDVPFDLRLQIMLLNLIGQEAALNETLNVAVSLSAGYTFQF